MHQDLLYNPAELEPEALEFSDFQRPLLDEILTALRTRGPLESNGHILLKGPAGAGKTSLLLRIKNAVSANAELSRRWHTVLLADENNDIGDLTDLWLAITKALGKSAGDEELIRAAETMGFESGKNAKLQRNALETLQQGMDRADTGLLLLMDNLQGLYRRFSERRQQSQFLEALRHQKGLLVIGTTTAEDGDTKAGTARFTDFTGQVFDSMPVPGPTQDQYLSYFQQTRTEATPGTEQKLTAKRRGRVLAWHRLTQGNMRLAALGRRMLNQLPEQSIEGNLVGLADQFTMTLKMQLEALPDQQRRVFDALLKSWAPTTARVISVRTRLPVTSVSTQLTRLVQQGLVQEVDFFGVRKGYQAADRILGMTALMREGTEGKRRLQRLARFLERFHTKSDRWGQPRNPKPWPRKSMMKRLRKDSELASYLDGFTADDRTEPAVAAEALQRLEPRLALNPGWATGFLMASLLAEATGNAGKALHFVDRLAELEPEGKHARQFQDRLTGKPWHRLLRKADRALLKANEPLKVLRTLCKLAAAGHPREAAEWIDQHDTKGSLEPLRHALAMESREDLDRLKKQPLEIGDAAKEVRGLIQRMRGAFARPGLKVTPSGSRPEKVEGSSQEAGEPEASDPSGSEERERTPSEKN